jgi:hypothetical protein
MKPFILAFIIPLLIATGFFLTVELLLDTYNTQQDRVLFAKTYEIVVECRKSLAPNNGMADKICGELPVFFSEVK